MTHTSTSWTLEFELDPDTGDIVLPIPPDLLANLGWTEGTELIWTDNGDGSWSLSKKI